MYSITLRAVDDPTGSSIGFLRVLGTVDNSMNPPPPAPVDPPPPPPAPTDPSAVPEPSTYALTAGAIGALAWWKRRRG
jgi:PEP-CTERM motif